MPKFDFTFARYGFASIEADTKDKAWETAKSMPAEAISWSDDCDPTDCNDAEEKGTEGKKSLLLEGAKAQTSSEPVEPAHSVEPFVLAGVRALSCYAELDTTLEREKALALNYALAQVREDKRSNTDKELLIDLVQRAVDFQYMADDGRFTELDIIRALLQDNCIEHLPTVLSADDGQFLMMAIAACEEMRAACEEGTCLHSERTFLELVAAQEKVIEERENFLAEDAVRKLPAGTAVTLVCEKGKKYRCMVLAPLSDEQLHLVKPDPKDNSAPLCFGMLYQGYGTDWNILI